MRGLPWITAVRLVGVPLAFVLMVCLSTAQPLRQELSDTLNAMPSVRRLMVAFAVIAVFSVVVSGDVGLSMSKLIVAGLNWFLVFYVSVFVFRQPGNLMRLAYLVWICALILSAIGLQEWRHSAVPWAGHIPSFLTVQDETVLRVLSGSSRAATGIYRVQGKFTTPLGFAEFYALTVPFVIHFAFSASRTWVRVAAALTIPLIFFVITLTDSRLGIVGFFLAFLVYLLFWSLRRWNSNRESAIGPLIVLAYPAIFCGFIASTFFVRRLSNMVWGNGAQQASTESRKLQYAMGLPKVLERPWGYGIGRGGEVLGFTNQAGIGTIDTYYLAAALEFGIVGFIVYYAMFALGVWNGGRRSMLAADREHMLVAPVTIALVNFIIIKSIFSQLENHALVFSLLGALVAICYRIDARKPHDS
ncbi:MAG: O-antigen ligase family protein [Sphingomonas sp.]